MADHEAGPEALPARLDRWLAAHGSELVALRRHIHAHPELSGQEFETAKLVVQELRGIGLSPRLLAKGNGVLCDIGTGGPVIALRADMDALPITDTKGVPYRSQTDGRCHACGHDVHTTVLIGVAKALSALRTANSFPGRVRLIFQPSEERMPFGAPEVIRAGGLTDVKAIYALHCYPHLAAGRMAIRTGPITAAMDMLDIRLEGPGGHTARPHLTADLVGALAALVQEVPKRLGRQVDPRSSLAVVFGAINAGDSHNVIPTSGHARATIRVISHDVWRKMPRLAQRVARESVAGFGVSIDVQYKRGVPPVVNDPGATSIAVRALSAAFGVDSLAEAEISMGGEDFAFYSERVPAAMIRLGVGDGTSAPDLHRSDFDIDERAIGVGVKALASIASAAMRDDNFTQNYNPTHTANCTP